MFFSVITKNVNWEILNKNLITFKRWDELEDEKFELYRGLLNNLTFRGRGGFLEIHEKPINRGNCLKKEAWTVCRFRREVGLDKKE